VWSRGAAVVGAGGSVVSGAGELYREELGVDWGCYKRLDTGTVR